MLKNIITKSVGKQVPADIYNIIKNEIQHIKNSRSTYNNFVNFWLDFDNGSYDLDSDERRTIKLLTRMMLAADMRSRLALQKLYVNLNDDNIYISSIFDANKHICTFAPEQPDDEFELRYLLEMNDRHKDKFILRWDVYFNNATKTISKKYLDIIIGYYEQSTR